MLSGGTLRCLPTHPVPLNPRPGLPQCGLQWQSYKHFFDLANDFLIFLHGGGAEEVGEIELVCSGM